MKQKPYFVGVDVHKLTHTAAVLSPEHELVKTIDTEAHPKAFPSFLRQVNRVKDDGAPVIFGLEDTSGLGSSLCLFLLEEGYSVREINPIKTKRERGREVHPDRSDLEDALAIAQVLARNWRKLPSPERESIIIALREAVHHREALVSEQTRLKNRLHALLHQVYPGYRDFFDDTFEEAALAFWKRFPAPESLRYVGEGRLTDFLTNYLPSPEASKQAQKILSLLTQKGEPSELSDIRSKIIQSIVKELEDIRPKFADSTKSVGKLLPKTGYKLDTMPGLGIVSAASIITQVAPIERFSSSDKLARFAGVAPGHAGTAGKVRHFRSRRGRRSLNHIFYVMALYMIGTKRNGKPCNPAAKSYYERKLAEGKTKKGAMVCLQRRLIDVVYAMMKSRSEYIAPRLKVAKSRRKK